MKNTLLLAPCALLMAGTVQGAAVLEEQFDYGPGLSSGSNISGANGGTGFSGAWANTRNSPDFTLPGKTAGSLPVVGGYVRGNAWSGIRRPIGSSLSGAGLMADGSSLWFSAIMGLEGQNTTNADINISLGTDGFQPGGGSTNFANRENLTGGEGIGIRQFRNRVQGRYWQNADNTHPSAEGISTGADTTTTVGDSRLVVGRIDWGTGGSGETLTLWAPAADLTLGAPIVNAWSIPDLDQSQFDTLAIQFKDQSQVDEIRFGATSDDVLGIVAAPVPEPSSTLLLGLGALLGLIRRKR